MLRNYRPLRDKIVVLVDIGEQVSKGGIIMSLAAQEESLAREEGEVLALGKACFYDTEPEDIKVGDRIAFAKYAGKVLETRSDGKQVRTMRDIDILCIIEEQVVEEVVHDW